MKLTNDSSMRKVEVGRSPSNRGWQKGAVSTVVALGAALALGAGSASAYTISNYLANPGFESGTNSWHIVQPWVWNGPSYAVQNTNQLVNGSPTVHVTVHGGTNAIKLWGYYQSYRIASGAQQQFAAAPGSTWSADGYVSTQTPDNITANANASASSYIQVQFMDAHSNILSSFTSPVLDNTSPTSTWMFRQVADTGGSTNLVAPDGTALVRLALLFDQPAPASGVYAGGSAYWDDVRLQKTSAPDPEITVQPAPVTVIYGQTATFSVGASGQSPLSYKWQKNGADLTAANDYGVTTSTLTVSNVTTADQGTYTVTVTDKAGPLTSDGTATLTVLDPGVLSITPALGQSKLPGQTATITVSAAGSTTLTYAWYKDGQQLANNSRISGVTTSNLTIANLSAADMGTYVVQINGGAVSATNGLKVLDPTLMATNLLVNPGFEDGVLSEPWENGWVKFNGVGVDTAANYYDPLNFLGPVAVWDGTYVVLVYSSDQDNGFYQTVPVTAGATYHAGAMGYMSHYTPVGGTSFFVVQLMFKDAGGNTLVTYASQQFSTNGITATDTWLPVAVTNGANANLVAPVGATQATFQIYEFNWTYAGGAVTYDDTYLTQVSLPLPSAVTITSSVLNGVMNLSFPTTSGVTYDVLYADSLTAPITWHTKSSIAGDGTVKSVSDAAGQTQRFYRVSAHY